MSDVSTILLVPAEAHRETLLGDGPCGARVPRLALPNQCPAHGGYNSDWCPGCDAVYGLGSRGSGMIGSVVAGVMASRAYALVLAHDGRGVQDGCLRAMLVLADGTPSGPAPYAIGAIWRRRLGVAGEWELVTNPAFHPLTWHVGDEPSEVSIALAQPWALATVCAARGLGTIILLDADGREVTRG